MNKPVFPSYQDLLDEEAVSVPEALRLDTQPQIANQVIATDVWTDRSIFEQEVENMWPKVWQMVCRRPHFRSPAIITFMTLRGTRFCSCEPRRAS